MIINSIELQNIRSYDNAKIEFPRGITLFEGDIGSGKSTILMGIEFALFGLGSQRPEALLSKKVNEGSVVLNFEAGDQKCEVKRALKRKGDTLSQDPKNTYLKINDEIEPLSPTELKQKVLQILNFNEPGDPRSESRIYRYAIFTPQEEMKEILYNEVRRLETIRKAFGVEDYKIAVENSKEILRFLHERIIIFKERFKDIDRYELDLKNSNEDIIKTDAIIKETENQEEVLENQQKKIHCDLDAISERKQEQRDLVASKNNIKNNIDEKITEQEKISVQIKQTIDDIKELEKELLEQKRISKPTSKTIEEINKKIKEFTELNKTISNLEYRKVSLTDEIRKLQTRLKKYEKSTIEELSMQLEKIKEERTKRQEKYESMQKELKIRQKEETKLELDKENQEKGIKDVFKLGAKCPHCEHELTEEHRQKLESERKQALLDTKNKLEEVSKDRYKLESDILELEKIIFEIDEEIKIINNAIPDLENFTIKNKEFIENDNKLEEARIKNIIPKDDDLPKLAAYEEPVEYFTVLKDTLQKYQNAEARIADIEKNITRLNKDKEYDENDLGTKSNQIRQLKEELVKTSDKLKSLEGIDEKFSELQNHEEKLNSEIKKLGNFISVNSEKIKNEKRQIGELDKRIAEAQKWKSAHKKYSNYHDWLSEFFIPAIDRIEKQVLLSIQQNFNEMYHRWYSILIDDPTKESRIDENFTPIIEQDGYDQDIAFLSGGEKTSVALAYRLTLNSLMRQESDSMRSNLLILDEPTDGFSKNQLAKVKTVLLELKSEQIILVSHEKELETYVNNIFQINKSSGISKVTRLSS